ncbi:hypothetical protein ACI2JA_03745 [Alkalihalobacillus sp. NPDC078783]
MNEQIFDKASEYIDAIATNLGVAAEHVYTLMTKQMMVEGIVYGSISLICIVLFSLIIVKVIKHLKDNWVEVNRHANDIYYYIGIAALGFAIVAFGFELPESLLKLFNPEYYVIKEIMDMFSTN